MNYRLLAAELLEAGQRMADAVPCPDPSACPNMLLNGCGCEAMAVDNWDRVVEGSDSVAEIESLLSRLPTFKEVAMDLMAHQVKLVLAVLRAVVFDPDLHWALQRKSGRTTAFKAAEKLLDGSLLGYRP